MKNNKLFSKAFAALALMIFVSSCGLVNNHSFFRQKYTNFKKGDGIAAQHSPSPENRQVGETKVAVINETAAISTDETVKKEEKECNLPSSCNWRKNNSAKQTQTSEWSKTTDAISRKGENIFNNSAEASKSGSDTKDTQQPSDDSMMVLLILLAIFLPPVAVAVKENGITANFWIDLLLCFLLILPGIIFALYIVLK